MNRRNLFLGLGASAVALALPRSRDALMDTIHEVLSPPMQGPRAGYFPNFTLTTHENRRVRFYDDLLGGKIVMVNFMYTTCEKTCPISTMNLKQVHQALGDKVGKEVHMLSFTINPEQDTPEKLAHYVEKHKIGKGWTFVTGVPEEVDILRRKLGFYDPTPDQDVQDGTHIGILRIGNEKLDRWAATPILQSPKAILNCLDSVRARGLVA